MTIQLPSREEALEFNQRRWKELCEDPYYAQFEERIETNRFGEIIMSPPPGESHGSKQSKIAYQLRSKLGPYPITECPIVTQDGVRTADLGWFSPERREKCRGVSACPIAPEICVEVFSPPNSTEEMTYKKSLYFEAGAKEVWFCAEEGMLRFYLSAAPEEPAPRSELCPEFPERIDF